MIIVRDRRRPIEMMLAVIFGFVGAIFIITAIGFLCYQSMMNQIICRQRRYLPVSGLSLHLYPLLFWYMYSKKKGETYRR